MAKKTINFDLDDLDLRKRRFATETMFEFLATPPAMRGRFARRVGQIAALEGELEAANEGNRTKWNGAIPREVVRARVKLFVKRRERGEGPALKLYQQIWKTTAKHIHKEFLAELERQGKTHLLSNGKRGRPKKSPAR
jgi:hypothetical protein